MSVSLVKPQVKLRPQEDQEMSDCLQVKLVLSGTSRAKCKSEGKLRSAQESDSASRAQVRAGQLQDADADEEAPQDAKDLAKQLKMEKTRKLSQDGGPPERQCARREDKEAERKEEDRDETGEGEVLNIIEGLAQRKKQADLQAGRLTKSGQSRLAASLHAAANEGKVELVRLLLRCGAQVNSQDEQCGNTALHQAAWNGFSQTVEVLCKYRANTSVKNKAHFSPLHLACQQGHNQSARLLLMANAKSGAKNSYGDTPLHTAARYGHAGVARILLSAQCDPNQVNMNHDTPLHIAAAMGRRKLTKILMQSGAEVAVKNKQGETAMDIALRKHLIDIQELIANPPAAKPSAHRSASRRRLPAASSARRLGALELAVDVPGACKAGPGAAPSSTSAADCLAPDARPPGPPARPSPAGSARSSLSRSRGRLLRAHRRKSLADLDAAKLNLRRANLGTCIGKLSLLRLRQLAHGGRPRAKSQEQLGQPADKPLAGRRQLRHQQALQLRAPNGTQLLVTRPLASLADESQLYAIPRKSKSKHQVADSELRPSEQRQQVASEEPDGQQERSNSRGPALTSDGGHTSSSSAGSPASERVHSDALGRVGHSGALVGVRAEHKPPAELGCSCACDPLPLAADQLTKSDPSRDSAASRLRQLLHLESSKPAPALSAIAGGYYAYSPVVTSRPEPVKPAPREPAAGAQPQAKSPKRFWLMSKLSLSSQNINGQPKLENQPTSELERSAQLVRVQSQAEVQTCDRHMRPKSAMSLLSSDLVAAQKSLAAAAAAKVRRDRLVRLAASGRPSSASQNLLTVKTQSDAPPDWLDNPELDQEAKQAVRYSMGLHQRPTSGTNSAGMSDSSPSNNGADSDNSTQTTGSLGILSRILLSSKNCQRAKANQTSALKVPNMLGEQVSVSSSLSSPATTNGSSQQQSSPSLLDQLGGSRSRRPIVASRLTDSDDSTLVAVRHDQSELHPAPRQLTPKSALKAPRDPQPDRAAPLDETPLEPLNGLPRVSSYTQLSSGYEQTPLCDYHALASGQAHHLLRTGQGRPLYPAHNFYSPYQAQAMLMAAPSATGHRQRLSQHDLRSQSSGIANYEYYLEPSGYPAANLAQLHAAYQAGMHAIPPYESHIYIPPYLGAASQLPAADSTSADSFQSARPKSSLDNLLAHSSNHNADRNPHPSDQGSTMVNLRYPAASFASAEIYSHLPTGTSASFRLPDGTGTGLTVLPANSEPPSSSITPRAPSAEGGLAHESPVALTGVDQRVRDEIECQSAGRARLTTRSEYKSARGNSWTPSTCASTTSGAVTTSTTTTTIGPTVYKSLVRVNQPSLSNKSNQSSGSRHSFDGELAKAVALSPAKEEEEEVEVGQENQRACQVMPVSAKLERVINKTHLLDLGQQAKQTNMANRCSVKSATSAIASAAADATTTATNTTPIRQHSLLINSGDSRAPLRSLAQQEQLKDRNSIESATNSSDSWSSPASQANNEELDSPPIQCIKDGASTVL